MSNWRAKRPRDERVIARAVKVDWFGDRYIRRRREVEWTNDGCVEEEITEWRRAQPIRRHLIVNGVFAVVLFALAALLYLGIVGPLAYKDNVWPAVDIAIGGLVAGMAPLLPEFGMSWNREPIDAAVRITNTR